MTHAEKFSGSSFEEEVPITLYWQKRQMTGLQNSFSDFKD